MTQAEFEALQVGDMVKHKHNETAVVYHVPTQNGKASRMTPLFIVYKFSGTVGAIYDDVLEDWSVVSRVITRENVQAKGGE